MSRLDELKKQYPELSISIFDLVSRMDTSKTYKYLPLLCKIFGERFSVQKRVETIDDVKRFTQEINESLMSKGISTNGLTKNEKYRLFTFTDYYNNDYFELMSQFMKYMDENKIKKNDVTSYSSLEEIRSAVSLATMNELNKELEGQVIKEYEDEKWVILRPLNFVSSAKYGAGTRWCTTYQREKQYFEKYWRQGILVYFINKETGYKFAGYKSLQDRELSFWNAEDTRTDYLSLEVDDYIFPIVKKIFNSTKTNQDLSSYEIQKQVYSECVESFEKIGFDEAPSINVR